MSQVKSPSPSPTTMRWLYDLRPKCPSWTRQWERKVGRDNLQSEDLFFRHHQNIAVLVDALPQAQRNSGQEALACLEKVLLGQFPADPVWKNAIRHRVGLVKSHGKDRKHSAAISPRILAPRRNATLLVRDPVDGWKTSKGSPISKVLSHSHPTRRQFIEKLCQLPGLVSIELPLSMDYKSSPELAQQVKRALMGSTQEVVRAREEGRTWSLAIRRIQSMGINGCFDVASQTIIVDPRSLQSIKHELCHWLLGHEVEVLDARRLEVREAEVDELMERLF